MICLLLNKITTKKELPDTTPGATKSTLTMRGSLEREPQSPRMYLYNHHAKTSLASSLV